MNYSHFSLENMLLRRCPFRLNSPVTRTLNGHDNLIEVKLHNLLTINAQSIFHIESQKRNSAASRGFAARFTRRSPHTPTRDKIRAR